MPTTETVLTWDKEKYGSCAHTAFDQMILGLASSYIKNNDNEVVSYNKDDLLAFGRRYVAEAIAKYKPGKNAKLSTYVHLVLESKFRSLLKKINRRKKYVMVNLDDCAYTLATQEDMEDKIIGKIDAERMIQSLDPVRAHLFQERFVAGTSTTKICAKAAPVVREQIKAEVKSLAEDVQRFVDSGIIPAKEPTGGLKHEDLFNRGAGQKRTEPSGEVCARSRQSDPFSTGGDRLGCGPWHERPSVPVQNSQGNYPAFVQLSFPGI